MPWHILLGTGHSRDRENVAIYRLLKNIWLPCAPIHRKFENSPQNSALSLNAPSSFSAPASAGAASYTASRGGRLAEVRSCSASFRRLYETRSSACSASISADQTGYIISSLHQAVLAIAFPASLRVTFVLAGVRLCLHGRSQLARVRLSPGFFTTLQEISQPTSS